MRSFGLGLSFSVKILNATFSPLMDSLESFVSQQKFFAENELEIDLKSIIQTNIHSLLSIAFFLHSFIPSFLPDFSIGLVQMQMISQLSSDLVIVEFSS